MKVLVLAVALMLPLVLRGADGPQIEVYRLVPAEQGKPVVASLALKLVNNTDEPFYFSGHGPSGLIVTTERKKGGRWVEDRKGICGTGLAPQVLLPKSYIVFAPYGFHALARLPAEPLRFRFTCYRDPASTRPVPVVSREFSPAEFVANR